MLLDLGPSILAAATSTEVANVEIIAANLDSAENLLRSDNDQLKALGENYLRSSVAGLLSRVLILKGQAHEAEHFALEAKSIAAPDDVDAQVLWRSTLARRRALSGAHDEALKLADEAVTLASATDATLLAAQAFGDRAIVHWAAGRADEAAADVAQALERYDSKGDRVEADALRKLSAAAVDPAMRTS